MSLLRRSPDGYRRRGSTALQVGALPYRRAADGSIEIMLVTSRGTGRWIIPKGWPMPGKGLAEAAAQEACEEAGVRGIIAEGEIGRFRYRKQRFLLRPLICEVKVYPLDVREELEEWPEKAQRRRKWHSLNAAKTAVRSKALSRLIQALPGVVHPPSAQR